LKGKKVRRWEGEKVRRKEDKKLRKKPAFLPFNSPNTINSIN
jgi:hypothetical protein